MGPDSAQNMSAERTIEKGAMGQTKHVGRHCVARGNRHSPIALAQSGATVPVVRIATWNVNSAKQRVPRLLPWLDERKPDVLCLQETKLADDAFSELLGQELADRGYEVAIHGEATWNGVAVISRAGLDDVVRGL